MKYFGMFMSLLFVFALLTTPIKSIANDEDVDEEIQKKLEEIEERIKDIQIPKIDIPDIPEIDIDLDRIQARVEIIEDIFDEDFPFRIERKILRTFGDPVLILDLDDETEKKIEDTRLKHKEEMIDYRSKIEKAEVELERILLDDRLDTRKYLSKHKEISKLREEMHIKQIENKIKIYNLIPDEKKEEAKDILFGCCSNLKIKIGNIRKCIPQGCNKDWGIFHERMGELKENMQKIGEKYKYLFKL